MDDRDGFNNREREKRREGQTNGEVENTANVQEFVLRLRPAGVIEREKARERNRAMRVSWDGNVRDCPDQRVSKSCCVFHKKKLFGESSSDESSSSSSDSDADADAGGEALRGTAEAGGCTHTCMEDGEHKHKHKRPKCTKDHCYCGTRFH